MAACQICIASLLATEQLKLLYVAHRGDIREENEMPRNACCAMGNMRSAHLTAQNQQ
jgi:hypothetical protein